MSWLCSMCLAVQPELVLGWIEIVVYRRSGAKASKSDTVTEILSLL